MNISKHFYFAILCGLVASVCTGAGLDKKKQENILFCEFLEPGTGLGSPL